MVTHLLCLVFRAKEQEMVIADMHLKPGTPWELCSREALRRVSGLLKDEFNMVFFLSILFSFRFTCFCYLMLVWVMQVVNAGFENEFYLLRSVLVYVIH